MVRRRGRPRHRGLHKGTIGAKISGAKRTKVAQSLKKAGVKFEQIKAPGVIIDPKDTTRGKKAPTVKQTRIKKRKSKRITGMKAKRTTVFETKVTQVTSMRGRIHPMAMQPMDMPQDPQNEWVDSVVIASYRYSAESRRLQITFVPGGTWEYFRVPERVVKGLGVAQSKGRYFHRMIRLQYNDRRIR